MLRVRYRDSGAHFERFEAGSVDTGGIEGIAMFAARSRLLHAAQTGRCLGGIAEDDGTAERGYTEGKMGRMQTEHGES